MNFDWNILIDFAFSLRWLWIIVVILAYNLGKDIVSNIFKYNALKSDMIIRDTKYDEETIIAHLDYIINEALDEYNILHITPKQIYYINSKLETEIIEYLIDEIPKRLSKTLITHLNFIYNESYVGAFIGMRIYMTVLNWVLEFNVTREPTVGHIDRPIEISKL